MESLGDGKNNSLLQAQTGGQTTVNFGQGVTASGNGQLSTGVLNSANGNSAIGLQAAGAGSTQVLGNEIAGIEGSGEIQTNVGATSVQTGASGSVAVGVDNTLLAAETAGQATVAVNGQNVIQTSGNLQAGITTSDSTNLLSALLGQVGAGGLAGIGGQGGLFGNQNGGLLGGLLANGGGFTGATQCQVLFGKSCKSSGTRRR